MKGLAACALAAALLTAAGNARADDGARCEEPLRSVQAEMDADARYATAWRNVWLATGLALFAGQLTAAALVTTDLRVDLLFGAAKSTFIPTRLLLRPPRVIEDARTLDVRVSATSVEGRVGGDACLALSRGEDLRRSSADDNAFRRSWVAHALVIVGSLAIGGVLGSVNGHWDRVALGTAGSIGVGEAEILTF